VTSAVAQVSNAAATTASSTAAAAALDSAPDSVRSTPLGPAGFYFSEASLSVRETDGAVRLTITREGPATEPASVSYTTVDGSAVRGQDFVVPDAGREDFSAGEAERTIFLPLIDDGLPEPTERFTVRLETSSGAEPAGSGLTSLSIDIVDDD
jgi:hypothetical protein